MWKAFDFDWRKWVAARAMKQRAILRRPCLSQQLVVCGLYFVHRWFAQGPRFAAALAAAVAAPSTRSSAAANAARSVVEGIVDVHLHQVPSERTERGQSAPSVSYVARRGAGRTAIARGWAPWDSNPARRVKSPVLY